MNHFYIGKTEIKRRRAKRPDWVEVSFCHFCLNFFAEIVSNTENLFNFVSVV